MGSVTPTGNVVSAVIGAVGAVVGAVAAVNAVVVIVDVVADGAKAPIISCAAVPSTGTTVESSGCESS